MQPHLHSTPFEALAKVITDFSPEGAEKKLILLHTCAKNKISGTKTIAAYHDTLLFLCAYADNTEIFEAAQNEMGRLTNTVANLDGNKLDSLSASGIAYTSIDSVFSLKITTWLLANFPQDISIHSFDEEGVHPKDILKHGMNEMEFEMISDEKLSKPQWLKKASGFKKDKDVLKWLLDKINKFPVKEQLKEQLFESLKLYITITPSDPHFSRSFGSIHVNARYFHGNGILKKFDEPKLINTKLPREKKLNSKEKEDILSASRIALILLNRETDPISYCAPNGIKVFELEHGLTIALFSIDKQWRLPMESYIGFMMFKNGFPMSYGGAWLFGKRSLIGINIFEAFRGGESAFVFAQLLRTYRQAFGAEQFEVEPYQFGKNNPEGLKSGAFWFYHRFGFRPMDEKLFKLAEDEHQKIMSTKGYRSSIDILKQFTKSNLRVNFGKENPGIPPSQISYFITDVIAKQFKGERKLAEEKARHILKTQLKLSYSKLKGDEKAGFDKLSLYVAFCLDLDKVNSKDKVQLIKLIKEKGTNEFEYILSYNRFPFQRYYVSELLNFRSF
jgi:hypothetical protein